MKNIATLLGCLLFALFAQAQPQETFVAANKNYQDGLFAEAAAQYQKLVDDGFASSILFYNLANAQYRLGEIGPAIYNYNRALKADPKNTEASHNLELANRQVIDKFSALPQPAIQRIFADVSKILSANSWVFLGLILASLAVIFWFVFLFKSRKSWILTLVVIALICGGIGLLIGYGKTQQDAQQFGVLIAANSYVKSAPAAEATDLFVVHEGTKMRVLDTFEGYAKITLPDGQPGWIRTRDIAIY